MTDEDRRKTYWLLKKNSSYTAWLALGMAYTDFCKQWMTAMKYADRRDIDEFNKNATKIILDGKIRFEKGLLRLMSGDRSVWRAATPGLLAMAANAIMYADRIMDPTEYVFDWMKNQDKVVSSNQVLQASVGGLYSVCERPRTGLPAYWPSDSIFDPFFGPFNFPKSLGDVPPPTSIEVRTEHEVPFDGIYEPEWGVRRAPESPKLHRSSAVMPDLLSAPEPAVPVRLDQTGCMNYLLAGTTAPPYRDTARGPVFPVCWRLIWKDIRYLDGTIPDEEADYLAPLATPAVERGRCEGGEPCPRAGWWFTPARSTSRRRFAAGEVMPVFDSDYGNTIWQWDFFQGD